MRQKRQETHAPGLLRRLLERLEGREQMLLRGHPSWPLLLLSYPANHLHVAEELREAWLHTLPSLKAPVAADYREMLAHLPAVVVVVLRPRNVCDCLGHHHPRGAESRLAKRLAHDMGSEVGEIDLAWEAIRAWRPQPLSSLAAGEGFAVLHFHVALLAVLLHELEHLAHPDRQESAVRRTSDSFYSSVLDELVSQDGVTRFGMNIRPVAP
ncbi:MAG: hypothetical protein NZV14_05545 [Bryobacteraceae bacterium]|nr:hypothetical protein [Bryobacteraceae bacterium]MDW8377602.1 hypothetical protein [Bryobacterales bacterium]